MLTVIFRMRLRPGVDVEEVQGQSMAMLELAQEPRFGFRNIQLFTADDGTIVTISEWESAEGLAAFREDPRHRATMERGLAEFFDSYSLGQAGWWYDWDSATGRSPAVGRYGDT